MEAKVRNFTQEYEDLKKQIELSKTVEDMTYSYIKIDDNNPLFAIAEYINTLLKPIVELKFTNNGLDGIRCIRDSYNSNFLYTDVMIKNLNMYNSKDQKKSGVQRFIIRDISTGKAQIIFCVDVWENGYTIIEKTNCPEFISHLCYDWRYIKKQTNFTLEKILQEKSKTAIQNSESNLYYIEQIRNFKI